MNHSKYPTDLLSAMSHAQSKQHTFSIPVAWENNVVTIQHPAQLEKFHYKLETNLNFACNNLFQYGYHVAIRIGLNTFIPMIIMIVLNIWAISTLIKSREALQVTTKLTQKKSTHFCFH